MIPIVEYVAYPDRLGFLPHGFWVAPSIDKNPLHRGYGDNPVAALTDMMKKQ